LIRTTTGAIYKGANSATITHYKVTDYSWTATTLTLVTTGFTVGTSSLTNLVIKQTRDDPINYNSAETSPP